MDRSLSASGRRGRCRMGLAAEYCHGCPESVYFKRRIACHGVPSSARPRNAPEGIGSPGVLLRRNGMRARPIGAERMGRGCRGER